MIGKLHLWRQCIASVPTIAINYYFENNGKHVSDMTKFSHKMIIWYEYLFSLVDLSRRSIRASIWLSISAIAISCIILINSGLFSIVKLIKVKNHAGFANAGRGAAFIRRKQFSNKRLRGDLNLL